MAEIFKNIVTPFLDKRDSEALHIKAREALHLAEVSPVTLWLLEKIATHQGKRFEDERLKVVVGGIEFENPVLVGAGWDKAGRAVKALHRIGFAGVEVGTVLAYPQEGNSKPRQWMVGPGVAMNRLGFNSPGMDVVAQNLEKYKGSGIPIGISLGKNKDIPNERAPEVHAMVAERLYDYAAYFVVNVSSPNTPGLRDLQDKGPLTDIVQAVNQTMEECGGRKPLFVKIAPDLTNTAVDDVIQVVLDNGLTGIVATNTTNSDEIKSRYGRQGEMGGISGNDSSYRRIVREKIQHIYRIAGNELDIIGVGGIDSAERAWETHGDGAKLLSVVTAIRYKGPFVAGEINSGLAEKLGKEGYQSIEERVGENVKSEIR